MADDIKVRVLGVLPDGSVEIDRPDPTGTYPHERVVIVGVELVGKQGQGGREGKVAAERKRWMKEHLEGKTLWLSFETFIDGNSKEQPLPDKHNRIRGNLYLPPPPPKKDELPSMDNAFDLARDLIAQGFAVPPVSKAHIRKSMAPPRRGKPALSFLDRLHQCTCLFGKPSPLPGDVAPAEPSSVDADDIERVRRAALPLSPLPVITYPEGIAPRIPDFQARMMEVPHMGTPTVDEVRRLIALGGGPTDSTIRALLDAGIAASTIAAANAPAAFKPVTIHNPLEVWKVVQGVDGAIIAVIPPGGAWTGQVPPGGHVGVSKENPLQAPTAGRSWGPAGTSPSGAKAAHPPSPGDVGTQAKKPSVLRYLPGAAFNEYLEEEARQASIMERLRKGVKGPAGLAGVQGPHGPDADAFEAGLEEDIKRRGGQAPVRGVIQHEKQLPAKEPPKESPASIVARQGIALAHEFNQMVGAGRVAGLDPAYQKAVAAAAAAGNAGLARNLVLQGEAAQRKR